MEFKLKPGQDFTENHAESLTLTAEPVLPEKIHIFRRTEPESGKSFLSSNIHARFIVWICLKGRGSLLLDNVPYILNEDDALIAFPGQPHVRLPLGNEKVEWLLIRFIANPPGWFNMFRNRPMHLPPRSLHFLRELGRSYLDAAGNPTPNAAIECACYLGLLLNSMREAETVNEPLTQLATRGNNYVREVCRLIFSPEFAGKSFNAIARHMQVSPGHLRALFKEATGTTPRKIIREYRIFSIRNLLQHSTLSISQIADRCGCDSVYTLSRFFSHYSGMSPTQYRKQCQKSAGQ